MTLLLQGAGIQVISVAPAGLAPLLDLEADQLTLGAILTFPDQASNHYDFTVTAGTPTCAAAGDGKKYLSIASGDVLDSGQSFADNLASMAIFAVVDCSAVPAERASLAVRKGSSDESSSGWYIVNRSQFDVLQGNYDAWLQTTLSDQSASGRYIQVFQITGRSNNKIIINGVDNYAQDNFGTITDYSNANSVTLSCSVGAAVNVYALRIYAITDVTAWNATDRAAIETELAARYGITL